MPASYTLQSVGAIAVLAIVVVALAYLQPTMFKREGFASTLSAAANYSSGAGGNAEGGERRRDDTRSNPNSAGGDVMPTEVAGPAQFGDAEKPSNCYPRDQLTPSELLPKDANSVWAQQNPMGNGSLKGKNFLSAGALIGVNTVGQSMRNANYQLRSEPPNPQVPISVFNNTTIEPDVNRRNFEVS
jgi:hypothetical protein